MWITLGILALFSSFSESSILRIDPPVTIEDRDLRYSLTYAGEPGEYYIQKSTGTTELIQVRSGIQVNRWNSSTPFEHAPLAYLPYSREASRLGFIVRSRDPHHTATILLLDRNLIERERIHLKRSDLAGYEIGSRYGLYSPNQAALSRACIVFPLVEAEIRATISRQIQFGKICKDPHTSTGWSRPLLVTSEGNYPAWSMWTGINSQNDLLNSAMGLPFLKSYISNQRLGFYLTSPEGATIASKQIERVHAQSNLDHTPLSGHRLAVATQANPGQLDLELWNSTGSTYFHEIFSRVEKMIRFPTGGGLLIQSQMGSPHVHIADDGRRSEVRLPLLDQELYVNGAYFTSSGHRMITTTPQHQSYPQICFLNSAWRLINCSQQPGTRMGQLDRAIIFANEQEGKVRVVSDQGRVLEEQPLPQNPSSPWSCMNTSHHTGLQRPMMCTSKTLSGFGVVYLAIHVENEHR